MYWRTPKHQVTYVITATLLRFMLLWHILRAERQKIVYDAFKLIYYGISSKGFHEGVVPNPLAPVPPDEWIINEVFAAADLLDSSSGFSLYAVLRVT
jgi:hypothetical protein